MTTRNFEQDPYLDLLQKVESLRAQIKAIHNTEQIIIPIWDAETTFPDDFPDGIEGQVVVGDNNVPYIWKSGAWVAFGGGGGGSVAASAVTLTPFTTIAATDVQAGMQEMLSELEAEIAADVTLLNKAVFPVSVPGTLSTLTGTMRWYPRFNGTITEFHIAVGVAPTGASLTARINKNGSSVTTVSISASGFSATTSLSSSFTNTDYYTLDITAVGSTIPGGDLLSQWGFVKT